MEYPKRSSRSILVLRKRTKTKIQRLPRMIRSSTRNQLKSILHLKDIFMTQKRK
jgi:hypothetical protein